jgi:hypothetical protein
VPLPTRFPPDSTLSSGNILRKLLSLYYLFIALLAVLRYKKLMFPQSFSGRASTRAKARQVIASAN